MGQQWPSLQTSPPNTSSCSSACWTSHNRRADRAARCSFPPCSFQVERERRCPVPCCSHPSAAMATGRPCWLDSKQPVQAMDQMQHEASASRCSNRAGCAGGRGGAAGECPGTFATPAAARSPPASCCTRPLAPPFPIAFGDVTYAGVAGWRRRESVSSTVCRSHERGDGVWAGHHVPAVLPAGPCVSPNAGRRHRQRYTAVFLPPSSKPLRCRCCPSLAGGATSLPTARQSASTSTGPSTRTTARQRRRRRPHSDSKQSQHRHLRSLHPSAGSLVQHPRCGVHAT